MYREKLEQIIEYFSQNTECMADNILEEARGGRVQSALNFVRTQQDIVSDAKALIKEAEHERDSYLVNARIQDMEKTLSEIEKKINTLNVEDSYFYIRVLVFFYISDRRFLCEWFEDLRDSIMKS